VLQKLAKKYTPQKFKAGKDDDAYDAFFITLLLIILIKDSDLSVVLLFVSKQLVPNLCF